MEQHVTIKGVKSGIVLKLDKDISFDELLPQIAEKFESAASFFGTSKIVLKIDGRDVSEEETEKILDSIKEKTKIRINAVITENKKLQDKLNEAVGKENEISDAEKDKKIDELTAENARLKEKIAGLTGVDGRYAEIHIGSLRSGMSYEAEQSLIILGDVKNGATVTAGGSIFVLGTLTGIAGAGVYGDKTAFVMALNMDPLQIRIADSLAISEDQDPVDFSKTGLTNSVRHVDNGPEVAEITDGHIILKPYDREFLENCAFLNDKN
ncbi:MAG: septum site-determining protein MinC [Lachnospiraceae bacterium]|nr:septum site-determining protein MinC [Lachnospiraceae bacterium]